MLDQVKEYFPPLWLVKVGGGLVALYFANLARRLFRK